jgi:hypothetical protein
METQSESVRRIQQILCRQSHPINGELHYLVRWWKGSAIENESASPNGVEEPQGHPHPHHWLQSSGEQDDKELTWVPAKLLRLQLPQTHNRPMHTSAGLGLNPNPNPLQSFDRRFADHLDRLMVRPYLETLSLSRKRTRDPGTTPVEAELTPPSTPSPLGEPELRSHTSKRRSTKRQVIASHSFCKIPPTQMPPMQHTDSTPSATQSKGSIKVLFVSRSPQGVGMRVAPEQIGPANETQPQVYFRRSTTTVPPSDGEPRPQRDVAGSSETKIAPAKGEEDGEEGKGEGEETVYRMSLLQFRLHHPQSLIDYLLSKSFLLSLT